MRVRVVKPPTLAEQLDEVYQRAGPLRVVESVRPHVRDFGAAIVGRNSRCRRPTADTGGRI